VIAQLRSVSPLPSVDPERRRARQGPPDVDGDRQGKSSLKPISCSTCTSVWFLHGELDQIDWDEINRMAAE
jgi:hypothetical protein